MNKRNILFGVLILWGVLCTPVLAQWSADPAINNSVSITAEEKVSPKLTDNGDGGTIISWRVQGAHWGEDYIYAQNMDANGTPLWAAGGVLVSPEASFSKANLKIISDGKKGAIISWYQTASLGAVPTFRVQRISADGTLLWGNGISLSTPLPDGGLMTADITSDNNAGVIATWASFSQTAGQFLDVYVEKIDSSGTSQWNKTVCHTLQNLSEAGYPVIANDGSGGAFIAWEDSKIASTNCVYAQYLNANGDFMWDASGIRVNQGIPDIAKCRPQIVCRTAPTLTGPIIVWKSYWSMGIPEYVIYAQQLFVNNGTLMWPTSGVHTLNVDYIEEPAICSISETGVAIAWIQPSVVGKILYMKAIEDGASSWGSDPIQVCFNGPVGAPGWVDADRRNLTISPSGTDYHGVVLSWQDNRSGNYNLYAQYIEQGGTIKWTDNGMPIASASDDQTYPSMISSTESASFVTWQDKRSGTQNDIYACRIPFIGISPAILSPANHAVGVTIVPALTWGAVLGATSYDVDIATDTGFTNIIKSLTGLASASYQVAPYLLNNFTNYYWRVRALNSLHTTDYASGVFTTIMPVLPTLNNPTDGSMYYYAQPVFSWSYTQNITGIYSTIQLTKDSNFVTGITTVDAGNVTNYSWPVNLNLGQKYYWRVYSANAAGTKISYSAISSFTLYGTATAPAISWPTAGATVYSNDVTAYWSVSTGSTELSFNYRLKKSTSVNWDVTGSTTNIFVTFAGLEPGTLYQYQVQSYNDVDSSAWVSESFTTNGEGTLAVPIVAWPMGGTEVYTNSPMVAWYLEVSSWGLSFEVGYGTTGDTTAFTVKPVTISLWDYLNGLTSGQTYHWRVRSINSLGHKSAWSDEGVFTVYGSVVDIKPVLNNPIDGQVVYTALPILSWSPGAAGVTSYDVYIKAHTDINYQLLTNTTLTYYVMGSDLLPGTVYDWYVTAYNASGGASNSDVETFETVGAAGSLVPVVIGPKDGVEISTNHPLLQWFVVSSSITPLTYEVQIATDDQFNYLVYTAYPISETSVTVTDGLVSGAQYYWRVRTINDPNVSAWSAPAACFVTWAGNNPVIVRNGGPSKGITVNTTSPVLSWYKPTASVPLTYDLQYSKNSDFSGAVTVSDIGTMSFKVPALEAGVKYFWRVRSKTAANEVSDFSSPTPLTVASAAAVNNTQAKIVTTYALQQNYPNPFNPSTTIRYQIPKAGHVLIQIYNTLGSLVTTLVDGDQNMGEHTAYFNAAALSTGIYYYRMTSGEFTSTRKLLLVK